ncbi:MAG: hypothetical protein VCC00_06910 [Deltaproteobacteria bacterium]
MAAPSALAQVGMPDAAFGPGTCGGGYIGFSPSSYGWGTCPDGEPSQQHSYGRGVGVQFDTGVTYNIVVAGWEHHNPVGPAPQDLFAVSRYKVNGNLDGAFGGGDGKVTTAFALSARAFDLLVRSDGSLIAVGGDGNVMLLAGYTAVGALDPAFGLGGIVTSTVPASFGARGVAQMGAMASDDIVVVGTDNSAGFDVIVVARFDKMGTYGGHVVFDNSKLGTVNLNYRAFDVFVDLSSQAIYIAGEVEDLIAGTKEFLVAKLDPGLGVDGSFGGTSAMVPSPGFQTVGFAGWAHAGARGVEVAVDRNEALYLGGTVANGGFTEFAMAKLDKQHGLIQTTTTGGPGWSVGREIAIDSRNRIVVVGEAAALPPQTPKFALMRFDENLVADVSFGSSGLGWESSAAASGPSRAFDVVVRKEFDGALLLAGDSVIDPGSMPPYVTNWWQTAARFEGGPVCGNALLEAGEDCENPFQACCSDWCSYSPAGELCRGSVDQCDADEFCAGASDLCPADLPVADGTGCDDGEFCNGADSCLAGACDTHVGDPCSGPDADGDCSETCDETADNCLAVDPDGSLCDDSSFCNGVDSCLAGACVVNAGDPCAGADGDGNCSETCDEGADNCLAADPDGSVCTDGLFCTGTDACLAGLCSNHTGDPCSGPDGDGDCSETCDEGADNCLAADLDFSACDDGVFCNGIDQCAGGICSAHAGDPCDGADGDANCSETCDEGADDCLAADIDGSACADGQFCNGADTCASGSCTAHAGDPCAGADGDGNCSETCDEGADNCLAADPDGSVCTDGLFCTGTDACALGVCTGAGDPCTGPDADDDCSETCDEGADNCLGNDAAGSACLDDGDACTDDECDGAGACAHPVVPGVDSDGDGDDDNDDDGIYDLCDNCLNVCNPAQENSDGDTNGGDLCDACPASDQSAEDPGCATADYTSTLECCRNTGVSAVAVDALGESAVCGGPAGDVILDSHDGLSSMQIPAGAVAGEETISIQENSKGGREYFLGAGSGQVVQSLDLSPDGISFVTPVTLCMSWVDANDNGFLDRPPYTALIRERSIQPHYYDENALPTPTTVALADACHSVPCGALDVDGFPTDWDGNFRYNLVDTVEDESLLSACCDMAENTYCWETSTFSSYGLLVPDDGPVAKTKIIVKRLDRGPEQQKLIFKGTVETAYPFEPALLPHEDGMRFTLENAAGVALVDIDLPGGLYDPVAREGWQLAPKNLDLSDPPKTYRFRFRSRNGIDGITKVLVKVKRPASSGAATITLVIKGKDMSIEVGPDDLPLQVGLDFSRAVFSGQRFLSGFEASNCSLVGGGKTAKCM